MSWRGWTKWCVWAGAKVWRKSELFQVGCESPGAEKHLEEFVSFASVVTWLDWVVLSLLLWSLCSETAVTGRLLLHKWSCGSLTWSCGGLEVGVELYTSVSRFLGARASIGVPDLCWKNMWCPEQEQHFSCQCCQYRMKLSWNVQSFLVISGSFTGTLRCSAKE